MDIIKLKKDGYPHLKGSHDNIIIPNFNNVALIKAIQEFKSLWNIILIMMILFLSFYTYNAFAE